MTIVVGYIPNAVGAAAVDAAIAEAQDKGDRLVLVNSGHHGDYSDPSFASGSDLEALGERLQKAGIEHEIRQPTRSRGPAEEILNAADEVGARLIVIGIRRRSRIGKMMTGSTAQEILLESECPVLSVKPAARG